jgi:hypothetical protein
MIILVAWTTKIFLHSEKPVMGLVGHYENGVSFYQALSVPHIASWVVAMLFFGTLLSVTGISIYISKRSAAEISEFGQHRSMWRI